MRNGKNRMLYLSDETWGKLDKIGKELAKGMERPSRSTGVKRLVEKHKIKKGK